MISYRVAPAIITKTVLELCDSLSFSMPEEFNRLKHLGDEDLISISMGFKALEMVENNINNNDFYYEYLNIIEKRWVACLEPHLKKSFTQAERLFDYYSVYAGRVASVNWALEETDHHLSLVVSNTNRLNSKFSDLNFCYFLSKILLAPELNETSPISTSLPFGRAFYNKYIDIFHDISFDSEKLSITVNKTAKEIKEGKKFHTKKHDVSTYNKLIGAANMIPESSLELSSLSFILGVSPRTLQRNLKSVGLSAKDIIRDVKFNHARRIFLSNRCNIKKTAFECGFKHQGQLTQLFKETSGLTPSQYKQLIEGFIS
ncbi:helix-turn-helix domain-containing protein [Shewanella chilikensis]|uniref:helix-turn-helix domain-containing protein n=1 Tax=Shewanella chilikensis TaxID=558541 RepID=UPI00399B984A